MLLRTLDLFGVAVFAASGALAGVGAGLDLLGVAVLAAITAVGGGTLRDVLLGERPVFWMRDSAPISTVLAAIALTLAWIHLGPVPRDALLLADALGLAVFALSGAQVAEARQCRSAVVVLMGTLTGAGGGVLRDLLLGQVPMILRHDIYASAAMAGIALYLLLKKAGAPTAAAFAAGMVAVVGLRVAALTWQLGLPVFTLPQ